MKPVDYQDVVTFLEGQKASCDSDTKRYVEAAVELLRKAGRLETENEQLREAMRPNCITCDSMHQNGNCTEVGGFCTSVPAAHCPLIPKLRNKLKETEAARDDALTLLHAYRHICGEHTPDELSRLVQADDDGRCIIAPFKVGQTVRHKTEKWLGQVDEITLNDKGLTLFVSSGGYTGYYPPDALDAANVPDALKADPESTALVKLFKTFRTGAYEPFIVDLPLIFRAQKMEKDMPPVPEIFCGPERYSLHCYRTCAVLANEVKRLTELGGLRPRETQPPEPETEIDFQKLIRDLRAGCKENCADCDYSEGIEFNCTLSSVCARAIEMLLSQIEKMENGAGAKNENTRKAQK